VELETKRKILETKPARPSLEPLQQKIEKARTELAEIERRNQLA
jgi:hypothetical protein